MKKYFLLLSLLTIPTILLSQKNEVRHLQENLSHIQQLCKKSLDIADKRKTIDALTNIIEFTKKTSHEVKNRSFTEDQILALYKKTIENLNALDSEEKNHKNIRVKTNQKPENLCLDNKEAEAQLDEALMNFIERNDAIIPHKTSKTATLQRIALKTAISSMFYSFSYNLKKSENLSSDSKLLKKIGLKGSTIFLRAILDEAIPNQKPTKISRWAELIVPEVASYFFLDWQISNSDYFQKNMWKHLAFKIFINSFIVRFYLEKNSPLYGLVNKLSLLVTKTLGYCEDVIIESETLAIEKILQVAALDLLLRDIIPGLLDNEASQGNLHEKINPKHRRRALMKFYGMVVGELFNAGAK